MKLFALVGYPLSHSFSKKYFEEKFLREKNTNCQYENFEIQHISQLADVLKNHPQLCGFNVTIPHKQSIMQMLHHIDDTALQIGAVNCVRVENNTLTGYNTDAYGFEMSIRPFLENKYDRALILGTGGSSLAVAFTLRKWNIPFHFATRSPKANNHISYEQLTEQNIRHFPLIINCTPLGTWPHVDQCPALPYHALTPAHFLFDLVYNPEQSLFLQKGKANGAVTMNGRQMLHLQAERSWQLWQ